MALEQLRKAPGIVRLHGHRGARGVLPENSLQGFIHCFETGVRAVEFDILCTADGVPVLSHNPTLSGSMTKASDGSWLGDDAPRIVDLTFEALQHYDVGALRPGSVYGDRFPDQAVIPGLRTPSFDALCALVAAPPYDDVILNAEIKSNWDREDDTPPPEPYAATVLEVIARHGLEARVLLQSFDWRILSAIARQAPEMPRSYLTYMPDDGNPKEINIFPGSRWMDGLSLADHGGSLPATIAAAGGTNWAPFFRDATAENVAEAQDLGLIVTVWTANAPEDIRRMIEIGVDGIITDYPGRAQRILLEEGLSWREDVRP